LPEAIYNAYRAVFKTLKLDRADVETRHALSLRASAENLLSGVNEMFHPNPETE
jgi:hypothetical protein